jgi:predicted GTPase
MARMRVLIMGAAGRDFHNFQVCYRDDPSVEVVAFTATQIPGIEDRHYPRELAGRNYPEGIPIFPEDRLFEIIGELGVQTVVFAYSDVPHVEVMHRASLVQAAGADFTLLGPDSTMLRASVPVISICAVRTGSGKSGVTERIWELLNDDGIRAGVIRHPMPYSDLARSRVERFASREDLVRHQCTVEEREEYEHYINKGIVVYAGVDYQAILEAAQKESEVILWDGGNNDFSFIKSDLEIVVMDPHRVGHERLYHPGEVNLLRADVLIINKIDSARPEDIDRLLMSAQEHNSKATIVQTASRIHVQDEERITGSRVLVIEDGPTLTHGEMDFGAGVLAARTYGAAEIVDPRPYAVGSIKECFDQYAHLKEVLPAAGYYPEQLKDLELTIEGTPCDLILVATPIDLSRLISIDKPCLRVSYGIEDHGSPTLREVVAQFVRGIRKTEPSD